MVQYHLLHLYHPHTVMPGSVMPAYPYLFEVRPAGAAPAPEALKLPPQFAPPAGFEVVPRREAHALVAYLLSLRHDVSLPEAPVPAPKTNDVDTATNAVPTAMN
jgi:cytochrome c oxidase cbb3-type subunit 2